MLLCNTDENAAKQENYIKVIISQRVDGVIIAPYHSDSSELKKLRDREIPTVAIDRREDGWEIDTELGDSVAGSYALVRHLIDLGHRRIAIISGPQETSSAEDRVHGYCLAFEEANIPVDPDLILRGEFKCSSGKALTRSLLEKNMHPTAIYATNNSIALGAIQAINQFGLHIPQDLALVCFDDIPYLSELFPFLTVAVQPAYEMGFQAARLLLNRL